MNLINIYFAINKECNLQCSYCYVPFQYKNHKSDDELIIKSLKLLLNKFKNEDYDIGSFCFHGAEPALMSAECLSEAVLMIEDYRKNKSYKFKTAIQSNGTRFTPEYLDILEKNIRVNNLIKLGFSIDPPKQIHDLFRNKSYDLVYANYLNSIERGFPVGVLSVITNEVLNHLDDFQSWMQTEINRMKINGNPYKIKFKFATGEYSLNDDEFIEFAKFLAKNSLLEFSQVLTTGYCVQSGNDCLWFEFDINGNCYSCNKNYSNDGIFANWENDSFNNIIAKRKLLYKNVIRHSDCKKCSYEIICNSGCPHDRIKSGINIGKAHECSFIKQAFIELDKRNINFVEFLNNEEKS